MKDEQNILTNFNNIKSTNPRMLSPLVLAYMGDAVYELIIRTQIVAKGNKQVNKMHNEAKNYVKASAQAALAKKIHPFLTEEEIAVFKRGRNAKSATTAKNATMTDYRNATGFEALVGYLYLKGDMDRLNLLLQKGASYEEDEQ